MTINSLLGMLIIPNNLTVILSPQDFCQIVLAVSFVRIHDPSYFISKRSVESQHAGNIPSFPQVRVQVTCSYCNSTLFGPSYTERTFLIVLKPNYRDTNHLPFPLVSSPGVHGCVSNFPLPPSRKVPGPFPSQSVQVKGCIRDTQGQSSSILSRTPPKVWRYRASR